jgi:hypothetical protein
LDPKVAEGGDAGQPIVLTEGHAADAYNEAAGGLASQLSIINMTSKGMTQFSLDWK